MDSLKPADIVSSMVQAGAAKAQLGPFDLLVRGCLSGALLGIATSLALGAAVQTGQILVGALIFPVGFVMIVLLGLELVTGSFAILPMALFARRASPAAIITNWSWVFLGNLIGSVAYAGLFVIAVTNAGQIDPAGVAERVRQVAELKTLGYAHFGAAGMLHLFRQGDPVQLDGLLRRGDGDVVHLDRRAHRSGVDADPDLLRPGLRACRRQHVHHPGRHDDGRQGQRSPTGGCGTRSPSRWATWWAVPCSPARRSTSPMAAIPPRARCRQPPSPRATEAGPLDRAVSDDTAFTPDQQEYLKGFMAGVRGTPCRHGPVVPAPVEAADVRPASRRTEPHRRCRRQAHRRGGSKREEASARSVRRDRRDGRRTALPKGDGHLPRKFFGLFYVAPAQNAYMCRLRIPGGILEAHQLRGVASIAEDLGGGYADVTTRANLQIREIGPDKPPEVLMRLAETRPDVARLPVRTTSATSPAARPPASIRRS